MELDHSVFEEFVHDSVRALILNPHFVCVAAKSAVRASNYHFHLCHGDLGSEAVTQSLAQKLWQYTTALPTLLDNGFATFIVCFTGPHLRDELHFEQALWKQLQLLHDNDPSGLPWDTVVSSDMQSPEFCFSFGGRAYFVVGLGAASSRWTRRFAWPTLIFNAHSQFVDLRAQDKFDRLKEVNRSRDVALQGSINPMLSDFGGSSSARQYAGRSVEDDWQCPFAAKHTQPVR